MCVFMYIHTHIYAHGCLHKLYVCAYIQVYLPPCICINSYTHKCIHIQTHACPSICMPKCIHPYACLRYMYLCAYIHIIYAHACLYTCLHMHAYICECMHICNMCIYVNTCTYICLPT